jgi:hypothetical protein
MIKDKYTLEELRDRDPFRVPEGYFEGFTETLMSRIPEKKPLAEKISLYTRVKPWLYMAAAFTGILVLFNVIRQPDNASQFDNLTNNEPIVITVPDEDEEFMEYIEDMYVDKYALSLTADYYFY